MLGRPSSATRPSPFHRRVRECVAVRFGTVPGSVVERVASPIPTAQRCLHILASSCCPWQKLAVSQEKSLLQPRARVSAHTKTDAAAIPRWPLVGDLQSRAAAVQSPVCLCCSQAPAVAAPSRRAGLQHHRDACLIAAAPAQRPRAPEPQRPDAAMNRQPVLSPNFHHYPAQHFHDPALASVSALSYRSFQLPHRTAELPAGYNPTPLPPRPPAARMSYAMASDDELAQLQKLSNEYQPEAAVSPRPASTAPPDVLLLTARRARSSGQDNRPPPSPPSTQTATPCIAQRPRCVCPRRPPSSPSLNPCQNLPYKYSHYRTCRGDGHCGWRGMHCCPGDERRR